jgi:hypothetical protein
MLAPGFEMLNLPAEMTLIMNRSLPSRADSVNFQCQR